MDWLSYLLGILGHDCCSVFPCFSNLDGFEVIPRNFIPCPQVDWYFLMMRLGAGLLGGEPQKKSTVFLMAPPESIWPACPVAVDAGLGRLARGSLGSLRCGYTASPRHTVGVCHAAEHRPQLKRGFARFLEVRICTEIFWNPSLKHILALSYMCYISIVHENHGSAT